MSSNFKEIELKKQILGFFYDELNLNPLDYTAQIVTLDKLIQAAIQEARREELTIMSRNILASITQKGIAPEHGEWLQSLIKTRLAQLEKEANQSEK